MTPECAPDFTYISTGISLLDNRAKFHQSRTYLSPKCVALPLFKILSRKPKRLIKMGPADLGDQECIMHQSMAVADFTTSVTEGEVAGVKLV